MEPKLNPPVIKIIRHETKEETGPKVTVYEKENIKEEKPSIKLKDESKNVTSYNLNLCKRLTKIKSSIYECIPLCIDTDGFSYALNACTKKIEKGCLTISLKIYNKEIVEKSKKILFVITVDVKTDLMTVTIVDNNDASPMILFTCSDVYPMMKVEKYLPTIVESTQTIINKM